MSLPVTVRTALDVYAGDSWVSPTFRMLDADGVPIDLSGLTWRAQWRTRIEAETFIPLEVTGELASGEVIVNATAAQTAAMKRSGVFDIEATTAGGDVTTYVIGRTYYREDITR